MGSKNTDFKRATSILERCHCASGGSEDGSMRAHPLGVTKVADSSGIVWEGENALTESQKEALDRLRRSLIERCSLRTRDTDADLVRFLRARSFDVPKARAMYEAMVEWRREIGADTVKENLTFPEKKAMKLLYPHFHHKTDKQGRPIYIERYGQLQLEELLRITTLDRLLLYHIKEWEVLIDCKFPACSKAAGRPISQSLTILDLKGVTMKHFSKQVRTFMQKVTRIDQDYYPEYLGKMLIINAPASFKAMWQLIKPWLDKNVPAKIDVHGSNFSAKLLEVVDSENLPEFLGGSCQCQGGCENSDAGPWRESTYSEDSLERCT